MSTTSRNIHVSVTASNNLESLKYDQIPVAKVFRSLIKHPTQVIRRWNWKSALLGAVLRASFYFTVYKASKESWLVTLTAVIVELSFRFFTSGISGALVQSFRRAVPTWLAMGIISISLPVFGHTVEYFTHFVQEAYFANVFPAAINNARQKAFAISVFISVISALFNIFMMRNGVLLVGAGEETKSLWADFKSLPALIMEFILYLPKKLIQFVTEFKFHYAIGSFLAFGLLVGAILGTFRGKWSWATNTSVGAWAILLGVTIITAIVLLVNNVYKNMSGPSE